MFGGNGFLGASSVERLLERGHDVTIVNRGNWYWDAETRIFPRVQAVSCDRNNGVHSCADLVSLIDSVGQCKSQRVIRHLYSALLWDETIARDAQRWPVMARGSHSFACHPAFDLSGGWGV